METEAGENNIVERVIPTENVQLMFHYRNPFVVVQGKTISKHQPRTIISGLSNSYSDVSTFGQAGVVFVNFQPAGACHFFRFPLSEIENQSFDLSDIFFTEIKQIEEQLFESEKDPLARANFWDIITSLNHSQGVTMFLTTQYLDEADKHASEMALIVGGEIHFAGSIAGFKKMVNPDGDLSLDDSYLKYIKSLNTNESLTTNKEE